MLTRRILGPAALLALALLSAGCARSGTRMYSFDASVACEARDCGCGTIEVTTVSGTVVEAPGEVVHGFVSEGLVVVAEAVSQPGWTLTHWSGDESGVGASLELLVDQGKQLIAHFERVRPLRTLEVQLIGEGGIDTSPCLSLGSQLVDGHLMTPRSALFGDGEVVHLTAYGAPGWHFESWIGFGSGVAEIEFVMDQDRSLSALFVDECDHD